MSRIDDNKLIAEFVGLDWDIEDKHDLWIEPVTVGVNNLPLILVNYHESWDWLIPVFEKIMDICLNYEDDYGDFYEIRDCIPDINQTYKAIVEFIKMYNNKKQK